MLLVIGDQRPHNLFAESLQVDRVPTRQEELIESESAERRQPARPIDLLAQGERLLGFFQRNPEAAQTGMEPAQPPGQTSQTRLAGNPVKEGLSAR